MEKLREIDRKILIAVVVSFIAGVFWIIAMRFVTLQRNEVHYHANFAVFIDGERQPFDRFSFYEEVTACGSDGFGDPKIRVHMHDQISHVVHVHDNGATWGHFFANLGFVNGDTVFRTDTEVYVEDDDTDIRFYLNGEEVPTTANRTINDLDVLLISIGNPTDADLQTQYEQIERDADFYNLNDDPTACSGEELETFGSRLKKSIGVFGE